MSNDNNGGQESGKGRNNRKTPGGDCGDIIALSIIPRYLWQVDNTLLSETPTQATEPETPLFSAIAPLTGSKSWRLE